MQKIEAMIRRIAPTDLSVLITGESGVGKELIAQQIYRRSRRRDQPFIKVNSAAIPGGLLESELFGYQRGAFTGADSSKLGRVQAAHKGTLFFDEIAELSSDAQAKLLQMIQERQFTPLGANEPVIVDVRIIAATNRDVADEVEEGSFRRDLFYRLNVIHIRVPSLRERKEDLAQLTRHFLMKYTKQFGKQEMCRIGKRQFEAMRTYSWPGNIRELENFIKNLVLFGDTSRAFDQLQESIRSDETKSKKAPSLLELARRAEEEVERKIIHKTLRRNAWNRKRTAETLQISYRCLLNKIKKLEIR